MSGRSLSRENVCKRAGGAERDPGGAQRDLPGHPLLRWLQRVERGARADDPLHQKSNRCPGGSATGPAIMWLS